MVGGLFLHFLRMNGNALNHTDLVLRVASHDILNPPISPFQILKPNDLRALFTDLNYDADFSPVLLPTETQFDRKAAASLAAPPQILS
jgi:hypothetical protein